MQRLKISLISASALLLGLFLFIRPASAMTISPPVMDFTLNPGDSVADVVQVYNDEDVPFKIVPELVNFYIKAGDETSGAPEFYPADEVRNGYELAPWITLTGGDEIVGPRERISYPIAIKVPNDAQPGSHFGGVQILAGAPGDDLSGGRIGINRGVTMLIFVRVNGDAHEDISVSRFSGDQGVYSHLPVDFHVRLDNAGNTHLRPTGDIFVKDMFGREVATILVNPGPQYKTILPGTSRRFDAEWIKKRLADGTGEYWQQLKNFGFGKYEATLVLNYGPDNKPLTATWSFWVIPWMALLTMALALALLIVAARYGIGGYNRMIIRHHEERKKREIPTI